MNSPTVKATQLLILGGSVLAGLGVATQNAARLLGYAEDLGLPWLVLMDTPIYLPWMILSWDWEFGTLVPEPFQIGTVIIGVCLALGVASALIMSSIYRGKHKNTTTFGSARWAARSDIQASGLLNGEGVVLGITDTGEYLRHDGPEHINIIAPTRSGKGVGVVIPTLLTWPHSALIYDLKRENWDHTAGYRSRFGRAICFNPGEHGSAHFNPLSEVRQGDLEVRDVQNIADMIVDPEGKGLIDHWAKTGHSLLVGTILHVLYAEENKTLAGVANFLSNPARDILQTLHAMMVAKHVGGDTHPVVAAAAREMLNKAENERSGVLSTAMSFLSLYRDPIVAGNTSDSDFRIADLMQVGKPVSLYLVIPPSDINRLRPLFRLMINQICRRLTEEMKPIEKTQRLLLLLDEFPALGRLDFFETALAVIAGYGIKALLISQSSNQLDNSYGPRNSIIDNTHIRLFFAPNTIETADNISRMLGQKTQVHEQRNYAGHRLSAWLEHMSVADHETARPLLTPGEVMELPQSDELIFVAGRPPIRARKIQYFNDDNFLSRIAPAPVKSRKLRPRTDSPMVSIDPMEGLNE